MITHNALSRCVLLVENGELPDESLTRTQQLVAKDGNVGAKEEEEKKIEELHL